MSDIILKKEEGRWIFSYTNDFIEYTGILTLDQFEDTNKIKIFLLICPNDIDTNFEKKNYELTKINDKYILKLGIEHIKEKIDILLNPQKIDDSVIEYKRMNKRIDELEKLVKELSIKKPYYNIKYYNTYKDFNIDKKKLIKYLTNFNSN